jgi:hypothetical protein
VIIKKESAKMKLEKLSQYLRCPICDSNMHVKTYYGESWIEEEYRICPVCKYQQEYAYGNSRISKVVCGEYFEFGWSHLNNRTWVDKNIKHLNDKIKDKLNKCPRYKWQRRKLKGCKTPKRKFKKVIKKKSNKNLEDGI